MMKENILLRSLVETIAATITFFLSNYFMGNKPNWRSYASFVMVFAVFSVVTSIWRHWKNKKRTL